MRVLNLQVHFSLIVLKIRALSKRTAGLTFGYAGPAGFKINSDQEKNITKEVCVIVLFLVFNE